jgi:hypothetical protein
MTWRLAALAACVTLAACDGGGGESPHFPGSPFGDDDVSFDRDGGLGQPPVPLDPEVVRAAKPPPPITGGTLRLSADGRTAFAADPDRDTLYIVDLDGTRSPVVVDLGAGAEPGRVALDRDGRAHVALRGAGEVATVDPATGAVTARRAVCAGPRGIETDPATGDLVVACLGGDLVTLPAAGGEPTRRLRLDPDLRDVVFDGDGLFVSRFRSAEVLTVDLAGRVTLRQRPPLGGAGRFRLAPAVAWRMIPHPDGGAWIVHQMASLGQVEPEAGGYGGDDPCASIVATAVSRTVPGEPVLRSTPVIPSAVLPVDAAFSPDGEIFVIAAPGMVRPDVETARLLAFRRLDRRLGPDGRSLGDCTFPEPLPPSLLAATEEPVAVAFAADRRLVVQIREPAALVVLQLDDQWTVTARIPLPGESVRDTGHALFHHHTSAGLACASCHPEGLEDGHVWNFDGLGNLRTQSLRGGVLATAPLHWNGDMADFGHLVAEVFGGRMSGMEPDAAQLAAFAAWIDALPPLPAVGDDAEAVARGRALFVDPAVGCATCHAGERYTDNGSYDVGTGGTFQVPSLRGVAHREPLMHDGCAATLRDRFGSCGGGDSHGHTTRLAPAQIDDLVAFLRTL